VVKLMVEFGVDVHTRAENGAMAVHFAAWAGNVDLIRALHQMGANMDAKVPKLYHNIN
jgi:ankyrin repeat protein